MSFAARDVKISVMSTNQGKRRKETKEMTEDRNVNIITDADGKKLDLINNIQLKGVTMQKMTENICMTSWQ